MEGGWSMSDPSVKRDYAAWLETNGDELWELYMHLRTRGREVFGGSFLQLGTYDDFARYAYRVSSPGIRCEK